MINIQSTRPREFSTVLQWLDNPPENGNVSIYGISGYGGVGKSYLIKTVFYLANPIDKGFLPIRVDGADSSILGHFIKLYDLKFAPSKLPVGDAAKDYFPNCRKLVHEYKKLTEQFDKEITKAVGKDDVKKAAECIFRGGSILNETIPKTKDFLDFDALQRLGVDTWINESIELLASLKCLSKSSWLPEGLKGILGRGYKERLRSNLFQLASDQYVSDLTAILHSYPYENNLSSRLLLVIDDFEILGKTMAEYIVTGLIPALEKAKFKSTIFIVGRDDLYNTHISFQHHFANCVKNRIRLEKFTDEVALALFREAGYNDTEAHEFLDQSQGYPFLVSLLCEVPGQNVSFYQQFYERTTRWLTPQEKKWVLPLAYLEKVTESSVRAMLPEEPVNAIMEWFQHEGSLRDPQAMWFVISPFIRKMLQEYHLRVIGTEKQKEFQSRGHSASAKA